MTLKKLPVDVSTFSIMRKEGYLYVDKTRHIYNLITQGRFYFLARPRRFGKSLLISTLEELFSGNRALFKDLWIDKSDYDWQQHPTLVFDFSGINHLSPELCSQSLDQMIMATARNHGISLDQESVLALKLEDLVRQLAQKNKVVILIDEYDYPLVNALHDNDRARGNLEALRLFFVALKRLDQYLRTIFITGVSKVAKTSVFSGLNNLTDLTLDPAAATLLGYTQEEMDTTLAPYITQFAANTKRSFQEVREQIRLWYNGYHFSYNSLAVYNPFSVLHLLRLEQFKTFWFSSGTPSFLIPLIRKNFYELDNLTNITIDARGLETFDIDFIPLVPLLFQTGYLTIADYDEATNAFKLDYPNYETRHSFREYIVAALTGTDTTKTNWAIVRLRNAVELCDVDLFCQTLQTLLAHVPYQLHIRQERYYHSLFQLLLSLLGINAQSEVSTDKGRIDLVLHGSKATFVIEIKLHDTAQAALQQIKDRKYYQRYQSSGKRIILIGISFHQQEKRLDLTYEFSEEK